MAEQADELHRRNWRLLWLNCIEQFANAKIQRGRWLDPAEANPYYSFVECMCRYFDDVLKGEDEPYRDLLNCGFVSEPEVAAVAEFHALADAYESPNGDDYDAAAIVADPAWQTVVEAAQAAQERLLSLLQVREERETLAQPLQWIRQNGVYCPQRP